MTGARGPADRRYPAAGRVRLDPSVRRVDGGRVLIGGSPLRVVRLTPAGAAAVASWEAGGPVGRGAALARRLLDAGIAHPVAGPPPEGSVGLVVPVRDRPESLAALLGSMSPLPPTWVVDDGSADATAVARVASAAGARVVRRESPGGPAAARNTGWRAAGTDVVVFVDSDCRAAPAFWEPLLGLLADPAVAVVAPRVAAAPGRAPRWLAAYEEARSPLDMGGRPSPVRPRSPVAYVPGAAVVARRSALEDVGGFDESLTHGEDVDLVWRLDAAGWVVRYEPAVTVEHDSRPDVAAWARQRFSYGRSAAPLAARHGAAVAPLAVSPWSLAVWAAVAARRPGTGLVVAAATTAALTSRLGAVPRPGLEALRLAGLGHWKAGAQIAAAVRRAWWPVLALTRPGRRVAALSALGLTGGWRADGPLTLPVWAALRAVDDLSYSAGVWAGAWRQRSLRALAPDLAGWPGRGPGSAIR